MIYLIITSSTIVNSLTLENYDLRKNNYIDAISRTLNCCDRTKVKPIIVECNNSTNDDKYLNDFACDVLYTDNNLKLNDYKHKGYVELNDIKDVIEKYDIKDDDFIIKITGRYCFRDSYFLDYVYDRKDDFDAFIKFYNVCTNAFEEYDSVLGLFAIRCKYLKEFNYIGDYSAEIEFATYVKNQIDKTRIKEMETLNLFCIFANSLSCSYI